MAGGQVNLARLWRLAQRARRQVTDWGDSALEIVCPPVCGVCREPLAAGNDVLCGDCWRGLQETATAEYCPVCGHDAGTYGLLGGRCGRCQNRRPVVGHVARVGAYEGVLRQLILGFKFGGQSRLDRFLGGFVSAAVLGNEVVRQADILVPIPLHWRRLWSRRYNQAELLTRAVARELGRQGRAIPVNCDLLRVRHTLPQTSMAASHRLVNLRGAFAARADAGFEGKHICLIDDVTTTGTTLRVAGQVLRRAGAGQVSAAVLAVAAND